MRVRFPSPAPTRKRRSTGLTRSPSPPRRWTHAPPHLLHAQKPPATPATHPPPEDHRHHHQPPPARLDATRTRPNAQRAPPLATQLREWSLLGFFTHTGPGTYRLNTPTRHHPRQPHPTLNYAALASDRLRRPLTRHPLTWKSARERRRRRLGANPISTIFAAQVATWLSAA